MSIISELLHLHASLASYYNRGIQRGSKGDFLGARAALIKAAQVDPNDLSAQDARHLADDALTGVIDRQAALHLFRGAVFGNGGCHERALAEFSAALLWNHDYHRAYTGMSVQYFCCRDYDQAISCLRRAIELAPDDAISHYALGTVYTAKKRWEAAVGEYKAALGIDPSLKWAQDSLKRCFDRLALAGSEPGVDD